MKMKTKIKTNKKMKKKKMMMTKMKKKKKKMMKTKRAGIFQRIFQLEA